MKNTSHKKYYSVIFPPIMKIICIILFDWKLEINFTVSFDKLGFLLKILREPNLDQDTDPRYFFSILNWVKFRWVRVLRDHHWGVHRAFMSCVQTDDASRSKSKRSSFLSLKIFLHLYCSDMFSFFHDFFRFPRFWQSYWERTSQGSLTSGWNFNVFPDY